MDESARIKTNKQTPGKCKKSCLKLKFPDNEEKETNGQKMKIDITVYKGKVGVGWREKVTALQIKL